MKTLLSTDGAAPLCSVIASNLLGSCMLVLVLIVWSLLLYQLEIADEMRDTDANCFAAGC